MPIMRPGRHLAAPELSGAHLPGTKQPVKLMRKFPLLPPDRHSQDPNLDGAGLIFEALDHGGEYPDTMPQAIRLTDQLGRTCLYVPVTQNGKVVDPDAKVFEDDGED
jgi:hypothetical protein